MPEILPADETSPWVTHTHTTENSHRAFMRRLLYLVALLPMMLAVVAMPYAPLCEDRPCAQPSRNELTFVMPGSASAHDLSALAFHPGKYATHLVLGFAASMVLGLMLTYPIEREYEMAV
jgi:hypothetical protein